MKVSIVIPTKDKLTRLRLTLQGLEGQIGREAEVIVVFDGCEPSTVEAFKALKFAYKPVMVVCPNNIGRSSARNLGIQKARGEIVVLLDDDRVPGPDFVSKHIEGQRTPCILLGDRQDVLFTEKEIEELYHNGNPAERLAILRANLASRELHKPLPIKPTSRLNWLTFYTGNVSVRREHLVKAGMFDGQFKGWGHEDLDLGIRLSRLRLEFRKDSSIASYHLLHDSSFNVDERTIQSLRNMKYMMNKYKYSLTYWVLAVFYMKHKLVGLSINRQFNRDKPAAEHMKG
jgi:glycosyltransferase involved in cell wall biosynthesis